MLSLVNLDENFVLIFLAEESDIQIIKFFIGEKCVN